MTQTKKKHLIKTTNSPISVLKTVRWFCIHDCNWMTITIFIETVVIGLKFCTNVLFVWHIVWFSYDTVMMVMMMSTPRLFIPWWFSWWIIVDYVTVGWWNWFTNVLSTWIDCSRTKHTVYLMHFERLVSMWFAWMQPKVLNPKNKTQPTYITLIKHV